MPASCRQRSRATPVNREAIDTWIERTILILVICTLGFAVLAFGAVRPSDYAVVAWLVTATFVLWGVRIWLAPKFRFLWPPICWAIVPFVGYAVWRANTAELAFPAREELIQILFAAMLFLVVVNNLYGQESSRTLCFCLVFLAMAVAMYGLYQWLRPSNLVWGFERPSAYQGRASGTFYCPNHLAGFLEMIMPITLALTVTGRVKPVTRILLAYATLVSLAGIAATQSRGGWIATAAALMVLFLFLIRSKGQRWIAVVMLVVMTAVGSWLYTRSVAYRTAQTYLSGHERDIRLRLWVSGLKMWKEAPWTGIGPDHFDYRFRQYREPVDKTQMRPGRMHNDYLNTLVDYGVIGLLLILLPIGVGIWSVFRCWRHVQRGENDLGPRKSNRTAIVLGTSAGLAALLVHSFLDFNMHIPANALIATVLLALLGSHIRFATERYWFTARWPIATGATLAIAASLFWLLPQAVLRSREGNLLRQAQLLTDGTTNKIEVLKKAFAVRPGNFETAAAIGEHLRAIAWMGEEGNEAIAKEAMEWFKRSVALNKYDTVSYLRIGMCLDWIEQHEEATPWYAKAVEIDPAYWYPYAMMGWHEFQIGRYKEAREWMVQSLNRWPYHGNNEHGQGNSFAWQYVNIIDRLLQDPNARLRTLK